MRKKYKKNYNAQFIFIFLSIKIDTFQAKFGKERNFLGLESLPSTGWYFKKDYLEPFLARARLICNFLETISKKYIEVYSGAVAQVKRFTGPYSRWQVRGLCLKVYLTSYSMCMWKYTYR